MQECRASTGKSSFVKRVTVRSGGAGHAHSGVAKKTLAQNPKTKAANSKIVTLGR